MSSIPILLNGNCLYPGNVQGYAYVHMPSVVSPVYDAYYDIRLEEEKLRNGLKKLYERLHDDSFLKRKTLETDAVLEAYRLLASDTVWHEKLYSYIKEQRVPAEESVLEILEFYRQIFSKSPFWEQRLYDLEDLSYQLIKLIKQTEPTIHDSLTHPLVLVAHSIGPSDILQYHKNDMCAAILGSIGKTSHSSILLQSLSIPTIIDVDVNHIRTGDSLLIESNGHIHVNALPKTPYLSVSTLPLASNNVTNILSKDGLEAHFFISAAAQDDLKAIDFPCVKGIGLYRTEFLLLNEERFLSFEEQVRLYLEIFQCIKGKEIYFRLMDLSGNKFFLKPGHKQRVPIHSPSLSFLTRTQIRALMTAYLQSFRSNPLWIIIPMVADCSEFFTVKKMIDKEKICDVKISVMVEIPSLIYDLKHIISSIDGIHIGSNDLFHFLYAIDRDHPSPYDELSPLFFRLLKQIQEVGNVSNIPVIFCGQMTNCALSFLALLGIGIRSFLVLPNHIDKYIKMTSKINVADIENYVVSLCYKAMESKNWRSFQPQSFRQIFYEYIKDRFDFSKDLLQ